MKLTHDEVQAINDQHSYLEDQLRMFEAKLENAGGEPPLYLGLNDREHYVRTRGIIDGMHLALHFLGLEKEVWGEPTALEQLARIAE